MRLENVLIWCTVQPILEESQCLMSPDSDQTLHRKRLDCAQCFRNTAHPSRHFTRWVHVVWLNVLSKVLLGHDEEFYHRVCQRFPVSLKKLSEYILVGQRQWGMLNISNCWHVAFNVTKLIFEEISFLTIEYLKKCYSDKVIIEPGEKEPSWAWLYWKCRRSV